MVIRYAYALEALFWQEPRRLARDGRSDGGPVGHVTNAAAQGGIRLHVAKSARSSDVAQRSHTFESTTCSESLYSASYEAEIYMNLPVSPF